MAGSSWRRRSAQIGIARRRLSPRGGNVRLHGRLPICASTENGWTQVDVSCLERAHYTYHGNKIYFCIFVIIKHIRCLVFGMCKLNSSIIGVNLPINKRSFDLYFQEQSTGQFLRVKGIEKVMDLYD
uniref:Uncharacterized protein n=1 Tax=Aegilops tauschii TaxID=37682 RepID=M8BTM5_AEGTA